MRIFEKKIYELRLDEKLGAVHSPVSVLQIWFDREIDLLFFESTLRDLEKRGWEFFPSMIGKAIEVREEERRIIIKNFPAITVITSDAEERELVEFAKKLLKDAERFEERTRDGEGKDDE